jgi:uncharacterized protein
VFDLLRVGCFTMVASTAVLAEYAALLRREKFGLSAAVVNAVMELLLRRAQIVSPIEHVRVVLDDPADDAFLDAAVAGHVDVVVSGDRHLLAVGAFRGIPILRVREFLSRLGSSAQT